MSVSTYWLTGVDTLTDTILVNRGWQTHGHNYPSVIIILNICTHKLHILQSSICNGWHTSVTIFHDSRAHWVFSADLFNFGNFHDWFRESSPIYLFWNAIFSHICSEKPTHFKVLCMCVSVALPYIKVFFHISK